jgi:hypothetical protein
VGAQRQHYQADCKAPGQFLKQITGALHAHHAGGATGAELAGNSAAFGVLGQHHEGQQKAHKKN